MLLFIAMFEMLLLYLLFTRKHISNHLLYIHLYVVVVVVPHHISPDEAVLSNQPRRFHGWDGTLIQMDGWLIAWFSYSHLLSLERLKCLGFENLRVAICCVVHVGGAMYPPPQFVAADNNSLGSSSSSNTTTPPPKNKMNTTKTATNSNSKQHYMVMLC